MSTKEGLNKAIPAWWSCPTAVAKYWNCKRCPSLLVEALEGHGGPGYIEESIMPRLYREAPLNSIWEGSGNVMGLDVLRAMGRESECVPALVEEAERARGNDPNLDRRAEGGAWRAEWPGRPHAHDHRADGPGPPGALLTGHGPAAVAEAFCASLSRRLRNPAGGLRPGHLPRPGDVRLTNASGRRRHCVPSTATRPRSPAAGWRPHGGLASRVATGAAGNDVEHRVGDGFSPEALPRTSVGVDAPGA